ncbi:hypothetical protein [Carboxylicivirga marina]|uniref:hypothetical protein n=1 Tax=Carboxylicivirga marina TaxID=2800988 RepID=UPI00259618CF|nr:hypothetical protein [uncultured Carboxylicivirga sp.]
MRILLLFTIICSVCCLSKSQDFYGSPEFNNFWQNLDNLKIRNGETAINYNGSPYLFETDQGKLILADEQSFEGLTMRYNVYNDEMEIKKGDQYYSIPKEKLFPSMVLDGHHFALKVYVDSNKKQIAYFEEFVNDSLCGFFIKHNIFLSEPEESRPYKDAKPAEFKSKMPGFYIAFNKDVLHEVKTKKDFLELAPAHQEELAAYIKKHKTKFKKTDSVKRLVEYYNSLQ